MGEHVIDLAVSIYTTREALDTVLDTIERIECSLPGENRVMLDAVVNGNRDLAENLADRMRARSARGVGGAFRVWSIPLADKANAWNEYVHRIRPPARAYFFVDGYAQLAQDGIERLKNALFSSDEVLGATGIPASGRSTPELRAILLSEGGLHGNFFALKADVMDSFRSTSFRLPAGLYRTDSVVGAALAFGADLLPRDWQVKQRIKVDPSVGWTHRTLKWWRLADLKQHFRRVLRQHQGLLEIAAVKDAYHLRGLPLSSLPSTVHDLIAEWQHRSAEDASMLLRSNWRARYAAKRLFRTAKIPPTGRSAELLFDSATPNQSL